MSSTYEAGKLAPIFRGTYWGPVAWLLRDDAGDPIDITAWTLASELLFRGGSDRVVATVTKTDAPGGAFEVSLAEATTAAMTLGDYETDVIAVDGSGRTLAPLLRATVRVLDPVTTT